MRDSILLLLIFATAGTCSSVVLYTEDTALEGLFCIKEASERQPFLFSLLEGDRSWGDGEELQSVVIWSRNFKNITWPGNIYVNVGEEIEDTEYGKIVFMERIQEIYEEARRNEPMDQAILKSAIYDLDLFTIAHLLQSSILSFYPLLVDLLRTLNTSFAKMRKLSWDVSGELSIGKTSTCTNVDVVIRMLQHDHKFTYSIASVYELSKLLVDYEPDLDISWMVFSWGLSDLRDAYEWAKSDLDKTTQALLVFPLSTRHQWLWRDVLRSICFRELRSFQNLPKHLRSIKIESSELGREHLILMLLFPKQSEKLSLMVWVQERPLWELFSILPLLPWQHELVTNVGWELYWDQLDCLSVLVSTIAGSKPDPVFVNTRELAQIWFNDILKRSIYEGIGLKEIFSIWGHSLSQPVILHQLYLRWYNAQDFDEWVATGRGNPSAGLGSTGCVVNNKNFNQEILLDKVFPKAVETDDPYVIFLLHVLLTMVFDEKKLSRWIAAYVLTAMELRVEPSDVIKLILNEELAGTNRKIWLEMASTTLKLFVPGFVFDDASYYTSVVELSASIRRQINLPGSIELLRTLKQQKGALATNSFIPEISSKISAEIGSSSWVVKQMLTKLLRRTQLLDIEDDYQNSSDILDSLYSRIDRYSFLRLNVPPLLDANPDLLRVDEIVRSVLDSHRNSFIQTAKALATLKKN